MNCVQPDCRGKMFPTPETAYEWFCDKGHVWVEDPDMEEFWRELDDQSLTALLRKKCRYTNGRPFNIIDIRTLVRLRNTVYGAEVIDQKVGVWTSA